MLKIGIITASYRFLVIFRDNLFVCLQSIFFHLFSLCQKLFLKLLLFPVFIVTTTLTIILNVILHLGSFAAGLGLLVMLYCIISRLWLHEWSQAVLATGMTAVGIGIFFGADIIIALFEEANDRLGGFIRNA